MTCCPFVLLASLILFPLMWLFKRDHFEHCCFGRVKELDFQLLEQLCFPCNLSILVEYFLPSCYLSLAFQREHITCSFTGLNANGFTAWVCLNAWLFDLFNLRMGLISMFSMFFSHHIGACARSSRARLQLTSLDPCVLDLIPEQFLFVQLYLDTTSVLITFKQL